MGEEYQRAIAALNEALPSPNIATSVADYLMDVIGARMPGSGTISTLVASDVTMPVPTANVTTNTETREVVGNKSDTAVTTVGVVASIIAYIKGLLNRIGTPVSSVSADISVIDGYHDVPAADVTTNAVIRDVIGCKTDTANITVGTTSSLMRYIKGILNLVKTSMSGTTTTGVIVQDGATGTPDVVAVTCSGTANIFGSWAVLDAYVSNISWICSFFVTGTPGRTYCFEIGVGSAGSESTRIRISFQCGSYTNSYLYILPKPLRVSEGTRVAARCSNTAGLADTLIVGLSFYQSLET